MSPVTSPARSTAIRRIVVAVDASPHSFSALEAAAEIAGSLDAELLALFVEDENLLRLSRLAQSREVNLYSAERRRLDQGSVQQMFDRLAARARELLHRVSQQEGVRSVAFRTTRGQVVQRLLEEAADADLVSVGTRGWTPGVRPGSTVRRLIGAEDAPPVMVIREGARLGTCPFAIYDGSAAGRRAIRLAGTLAGREDARVTVLVTSGPEAGSLEERAREAEETLKEAGAGGAVRELSPEHAAQLVDFLRRRDCGILVTPATVDGDGGRRVQEVLSRARCPVLLVH